MQFADAPVIKTPRLTLRGWEAADLPPFATLNADPRVTEFLPRTLTGTESDALVARIQDHFARHGFGWWAVEISQGFAGFVGLGVPGFEAAFTPCVEIGWRLSADHWGRGYATEAARAVAGFAFGQLGLSELVSFTVPANLRSRAVMTRLGMRHDPTDDFEHPSLPPGHPLRPHVLYRLAAGDLE